MLLRQPKCSERAVHELSHAMSADLNVKNPTAPLTTFHQALIPGATPLLGFALAVTFCVALSACGGGGGGENTATVPPPPPAAAPPGPGPLLVTTSPTGGLASGFRRAIASAQAPVTDDGGAGFTPGAPALETDGGGFTTTYRLEADVDELDFVKYDGKHMFIAPTRGAACCFEVEPVAEGLSIAPPPPRGPRQIRILRTNADAATAEQIGSIELTDDASVEGLFSNDSQLMAVTSTAWWGYHGDQFSSLPAWESQTVGLQLFDMSDPVRPALTWSMSLEGALVTGRQIGSRVLLVSRHYPQIDNLLPGSTDPEVQATNQAVLETVSATDLLPGVLVNNEDAPDVLSESDCLVTNPEHPIAPDATGYPILTTIILIDLENPSVTDARCYAEAADGVYVAPGSIYLAQTVYDDPDALDSIVHRFDLNTEISYRGSARVAGSLLGRGQADFRMSEHDDVLRMVTTRWNRENEDDRFDHYLYTLQPSASEAALVELARLPSDDSSTPIGKPNEDLFGVRFLGDRAYLVTFEQIDPLYVIDLSDPSAPSLAGELEVPGFSDLLHPVSESLLLGLGADAEGQVKLELFEVSDANAPQSRGTITLAEDAVWSWTEARYDRRAFTYLNGGAAGVDRITVPMSVGISQEEEFFAQEEQLHMFEIRGKDSATSASLVATGVLRVTDAQPFELRPRGVLDGDAVFFLLGEELWGGFWGLDAPALGPF
ncbi:MAG: beta-propeller domain-containing protein [Pseudomonadota bacterium]